jgi:hypothetical protein
MRVAMENKTARLTLLIDPNKKAAFERLCAQRDLTASQVVRQLIRDYLAEHGVSYVPSGPPEMPGTAPASPTSPAKSVTSTTSTKPAKPRRRP